MTAIKKFLVILVVGAVALLGFGLYLADTPDGKARSHERAVIEKCKEDLSDPSISDGAKRLVVAPACRKLEDDFRQKWNLEP
jgi:hypothetical protein